MLSRTVIKFWEESCYFAPMISKNTLLLFPVRRLPHQSRCGTAVDIVIHPPARGRQRRRLRWRQLVTMTTTRMRMLCGRDSTVTLAWAPHVYASLAGYAVTTTPTGTRPPHHPTRYGAPPTAATSDLPPPFHTLTVRLYFVMSMCSRLSLSQMSTLLTPVVSKNIRFSPTLSACMRYTSARWCSG